MEDEISLWSVATEPRKKLKGHKGAVLRVKYNESGKYVMSCGQDRTIRLWNPDKELLIKTYLSHGYEVYDVSISGDNSRFLSVGGDLQAFWWDVTTGRTIRKLRGHSGRVYSCDLNSESTVAVTGSYDKSACIWDLRTNINQPMQTLNDPKDAVTCVRFAKSSILCSSLDGCLRDYDIRIGLLRTDKIGEPLVSLSPTADEQATLCACLDSNLRLINKEDGRVLQTYSGHRNDSYRLDCVMSYDHTTVLCGSEDSKIYAWDFENGTQIAEHRGHSGIVCGIAYHPEKHCFVSSSVDGSLCVWY